MNIPLVLCGILSLLIALQLTYLLRTSPYVSSVAATRPNVAIAAGIQPGATGLEQIIRQNLFGSSEVSQLEPAAAADLVLQGVLAADDPAAGLAMVRAGDSVAKLYRVGQELPGRLVLTGVYVTRIVFERDGSTGELWLPSLADSRAGGTNGSAAAAAGVDASGLLVAEVQIPKGPAATFQTSPAVRSGKLQGLTLVAGADWEMFDRLGLRGGDILTHVLGKRLTSAGGGAELLAALRMEGDVSVTVLRAGKERELWLRPADVMREMAQEKEQQRLASSSDSSDPMTHRYANLPENAR